MAARSPITLEISTHFRAVRTRQTLWRSRATPPVLVGFAAETGDLLARARDKRVRKNVDLMVANDVTAPGAGFDVETNAVTIIGADQEQALPVQSKARVADAILDRVEQILRTRTATVAR